MKDKKLVEAIKKAISDPSKHYANGCEVRDITNITKRLDFIAVTVYFRGDRGVFYDTVYLPAEDFPDA